MRISTFSARLGQLMCLVFLLNVTTFLEVTAQVSKGKKLFLKEHYRRAMPVFEEVIQKDSTDAEAYYYGGICHLLNYDNEVGLQYMQKALVMNPDVDKKHQDYWLGVAYHYNYKFDSARQYFSAYKNTLSKKDQRHENLDKWLHEVDWANKHTDIRTRYWVEKLQGEINSEHSEHSPIISRDGQTLIYTSRDSYVTGKKIAYDGDFYEDIYRVTVLPDGSWSKPEKISQLLNTKSHDASCQLFDDGNQMLLYRWKRGGDLFVSKKGNDGQWNDAVSLPKGIINTRHYESHGFITEDGKSLFFASNRGNVRSDLDIYVSKRASVNDEWSKPEKLGENINTPYDDDSPFVTPDGKELYFSSRGRNSMGGFDIFRSTWDEDSKSWGPAENMGTPVNTPEDDIYLVWQNNGWQGYFASNRVVGEGEKDIYRFGRVFDIRLEGVVYSEETKLPLSGIKLDFVNNDYNVDYRFTTDEEGDYGMTIASDLAFDLGFILEIPNKKMDDPPFFEDTVHIPLAKVPNIVIRRDFYIPEPTTTINLIGTVTNKDTGEPINGKIVVGYDKIEKTLTDLETSQGNFNTDLTTVPNSSLKLDFIDENNNRYENVANFTTPLEGTVRKDITLEFKGNVDNPDNPDGVITIKEDDLPDNIFYDFDKDNIRPDAAAELDKWVTYLREHPTAKIDLLSHTDSRGSNAYNIDLSQRRANSAEKYLIAKGVAPSRITKKMWFGETKLTNDCADDEPCSKQAHQSNRRTELVLDKQ